MSLLTKFDQGAVRVGFILDQVCMVFFCFFDLFPSYKKRLIHAQSTAKLQIRISIYKLCIDGKFSHLVSRLIVQETHSL